MRSCLYSLRLRHINLACLILIPIRKNVADPRAIRQSIHLLEVLFRDLERLCGDIGDILPHQLSRIDACLVDLLQQEAPERFNPTPQKRAVEGDIDALEWNGGEPALQINWFRFGLGLLRALSDDFDQVLLDVFKRHRLHQRLNVDFLGLDVIGDVGEAVESAKITGANVLHVGDVVIDDLEEPFGFFGDVFDDVL